MLHRSVVSTVGVGKFDYRASAFVLFHRAHFSHDNVLFHLNFWGRNWQTFLCLVGMTIRDSLVVSCGMEANG